MVKKDGGWWMGNGGWRSLLIAVLLHHAPSTIHHAVAAGPGTTAADSLNLGMGPRASAMGDAFTGLADDSSALYWNPAGLARLYMPEAQFTYTDMFTDTQQHYAAYAHPFPASGTAYGASLSRLQVLPFQGYDNSAAKTSNVSASDTVLTLGAAKRTERLSAGLTLKYIRSELAGVTAQTPSLDLGLMWLARESQRDGRLDFGVSYSNAIGELKYDSAAFPLPRTLRAGASFSKSLRMDDVLTVNADAIRGGAAKGMEYAAGAEYWLLNLVALRAGFRTGQDIGSGFRAGLGLRVRAMSFDYAYAGFGDLGLVHRAAVSLRFGDVRVPEALEATRLFERAAWLDSKGRYLEEVMALNRILDLDPGNVEALDRMKAAAGKAKQEKRP